MTVIYIVLAVFVVLRLLALVSAFENDAPDEPWLTWDGTEPDEEDFR